MDKRTETLAKLRNTLGIPQPVEKTVEKSEEKALFDAVSIEHLKQIGEAIKDLANKPEPDNSEVVNELLMMRSDLAQLAKNVAESSQNAEVVSELGKVLLAIKKLKLEPTVVKQDIPKITNEINIPTEDDPVSFEVNRDGRNKVTSYVEHYPDNKTITLTLRRDQRGYITGGEYK